MRILVVDDDPDLVWLCRKTLQSEGHQVLTANDARSGLALAFKELPDLIVLDIMWPKDGHSFLAELRASRSTRETPVVLLTGRSPLDDELRGWAHGADVYLTKPFSPLVLGRVVKSIFATSVPDRLARREQHRRNLTAIHERRV